MGWRETLTPWLKEEFRWKAFLLGGTKPNLFITPQGRWLFMPWSFMTYRGAIALYQLIFVILTLVYWGEDPFYSEVDTRAKWLIYISNWTYLMVLIYFLIAATTTFFCHLRQAKTEDVDDSIKKTSQIEMGANNPVKDSEAASRGQDEHTYTTPWYLQLQRFCQVYACSASVCVTILFWVLVYDPDDTVVHVFNTHVHGVAMLLMIIDTLLVATPFRILHMVYVMLVAFIYFCFTAIYHAAGGRNPSNETYIYSGSLDWSEAPKKSAVVGVLTVLVAAPILHIVFYGFYQLRLAFGRCFRCCTHHDSDS